MPRAEGVRLIIRKAKAKEKTKSGIYIPPEMQMQDTEACQVATVLNVGRSAYKGKIAEACGTDEPWVKVGDRIHFKQYVGTRVPVKDPESLPYVDMYINDVDVLGVLEPGDDFYEDE